jgi:hypothetical protein
MENLRALIHRLKNDLTIIKGGADLSDLPVIGIGVKRAQDTVKLLSQRIGTLEALAAVGKIGCRW